MMEHPPEDTIKIQDWAAALADPDSDRRIDALRQMSSCESVCGLTATVVAMAGDADDEVRLWAAEAMERAVCPQATEVESLIRMMVQAPDGEICYWAATMLGRIGIDASDAVAALIECVAHSGFLAARERAVWALAQLGRAADPAIPTLRAAANQMEHPRLQRLATEALKRLTGSAAA